MAANRRITRRKFISRLARTALGVGLAASVGTLAACQGALESTPTAVVETPSASPVNTTPCALPTIAVPPTPEFVPPLNQTDPSTGLHVTGVREQVIFTTYRFRVTGAVVQTLEYTFDQLRCLPKVTSETSMTCPGFFTDVTTWGGVPMEEILQRAGLKPEASTIVLVSAGGYEIALSLAEARQPGNFIAYEWDGKPIPQLNGFPVRAILPGMYGSQWVKWLKEIRVI